MNFFNVFNRFISLPHYSYYCLHFSLTITFSICMHTYTYTPASVYVRAIYVAHLQLQHCYAFFRFAFSAVAKHCSRLQFASETKNAETQMAARSVLCATLLMPLQLPLVFIFISFLFLRFFFSSGFRILDTFGFQCWYLLATNWPTVAPFAVFAQAFFVFLTFFVPFFKW